MSMTERLKKQIEEADVIVIGAGAGLSTAAGFEYGGDYFLEHFPDMHRKYGYTDMYSAGFHDFATSEEKWGYWARFIYLQRYKEGAKPLYRKLFDLVKDKNYFVIINSNCRVLIDPVFFIRRAITACFNAPSLATKKPMITKR